MTRLFLTAPTTCALLLGGGLLLRAQAVLRTEAPRPVVHSSVDKAVRNEPADDEQPVAAQLGRSKQATLRRGTDGVWREQPRSHSGNASAARGRQAKRAGRR